MQKLKKLTNNFFNHIVGIDINKYNELKQEFDAFKIQTDKNFKKWFDKMPIGYAVQNKTATSHNKKVITNKSGVLAFAWAMHQPKDSLNKYLSNIHSSFSYNLANEDILFNVYKQNIHSLQMDSNANLITNATIDGCEYKFFYDFGVFEEFAKKQYDAGFNEIDKILTELKGMEYKINRN
jgi:hypothetical protein